MIHGHVITTQMICKFQRIQFLVAMVLECDMLHVTLIKYEKEETETLVK